MTEIYPDSTSAFISNIGPGLLIAADSTSAAMRAARLQQNAASQNADTQEQELQETVQSLLEDVRGLQQRFAANGMLTAAAQAAFEALVDISVLRAPGDSDSLSATGGGAPDGGAEDGHAVAGLVTHGTNEVTQIMNSGELLSEPATTTTSDIRHQAAAATRRDTDDQRSSGWTANVLHPVASLKKVANRVAPSESTRRNFKERRQFHRERSRESFRDLRRTLTPRR